MTDKLIIFDTTLRDGEQSPGVTMTSDNKVRIAKALERLKVDVIEAGFPAASPGDFEAVQAVARAIKETTVCGLARALDRDIDQAGAALKDAKQIRIHTFIATSPIHMQYKLRMKPDQVLELAVKAIKRARQYTDDVEFSPEDAGRSEEDFLCRILEAVIDAGATTLNIPDTVGYAMPHQFGQRIHNLITRIPNAHKAIFSVHCHNDLGLAVANSLSAVLNGARQVECTINGLGERAGNAALEEVVMAVATRKDVFSVHTDVDTREIVACSKLVSSITGFPVQPNKAIVGANAFAHESGIHQDGVLKHRETYEIMRAEDVGWATNRMVLGKHSGRNAFRSHVLELGEEIEDDAILDLAFERFKALTDIKYEVFDEDIRELISEARAKADDVIIECVALKYVVGSGKPEASVTLRVNGREENASETGDGAVDACFKAIERILSTGMKLRKYSVNALTSGTDAQGKATVQLEKNGRFFNGQGADTDVVTASVKAYIHAANRLLRSVSETP